MSGEDLLGVSFRGDALSAFSSSSSLLLHFSFAPDESVPGMVILLRTLSFSRAPGMLSC